MNRLTRTTVTRADGVVEINRFHFDKMRDRIEALEAENERLREVLREYVYETTHLSPQENDGSHWCKISANCLNNARAALGEKQ